MRRDRRFQPFNRRKPSTPWRELERRRADLPPMPEEERAAEVVRLCCELGLNPAEIPRKLPDAWAY